jgi:hypothetical protein
MQLPFWKGLFETPSPDVQIPTRESEILASMTKPITVADVGSQLRLLADGCKGLDGVPCSALRCVP